MLRMIGAMPRLPSRIVSSDRLPAYSQVAIDVGGSHVDWQSVVRNMRQAPCALRPCMRPAMAANGYDDTGQKVHPSGQQQRQAVTTRRIVQQAVEVGPQ